MKNYNELEWYVLIHDINDDIIRHFNIFRSSKVQDMVNDALKHYTNFEAFKTTLTKIFKYEYLSKAEFEIYVNGMFSKKESRKIDVYYQIEPNINIIAEYIINTYNKTKRKKIKI